jgi:hypothetical protein
MPLMGILCGVVLAFADVRWPYVAGTDPSYKVKLGIVGVVAWHCARRWEPWLTK